MYFSILSLFFALGLSATPVNDTCSDAIELDLQEVGSVLYTLGNLGGATESTPACSGSVSTDVWYSFTATTKAIEIYFPSQSGLDLAFELFDSCGGESIVCMDSNTTSYSEAYYSNSFIIGQTYFIKVFLYNQSFTNAPFELAVISASQPNETCDQSISLSVQDVDDFTYTQGNLGGATESTPACSGSVSTDVWYSFTATSEAIEVYLAPQSGLDLAFELFDSCGGESIVCMDSNSTSYSEAYFADDFIIGDTYFIKVFLFNQSLLDAPIQIVVLGASPENDDCDTSIEIPVQNEASAEYFQANLGGATQSMLPCVGTRANDVWFSFVATSTNLSIFLSSESSFDGVFEVFDACDGERIACINDNGTNFSESYYDTNYSVDATYFIRVYGYNQFYINKEINIKVTDETLSLEDAVNNAHLSLYPNPSSSILRVETEDNLFDTVQVLSTTGLLLFEKSFENSISLNVSRLTHGVYFIKVFNKETKQHLVRKFIRE